MTYIYIWEWDLWRRLRTLKRMATVKCLRNHHQESPISLHQSQPCQGISCLQLFLVEDLSAWQRLQTALTTVQKLTSPKNNAAEVFGTLLWRLLTSKQEKIQNCYSQKMVYMVWSSDHHSGFFTMGESTAMDYHSLFGKRNLFHIFWAVSNLGMKHK